MYHLVPYDPKFPFLAKILGLPKDKEDQVDVENSVFLKKIVKIERKLSLLTEVRKFETKALAPGYALSLDT